MFPCGRPLESLLTENSLKYGQSLPFPHIVIDDFLDPSLAHKIAGQFPETQDAAWYRYSNSFEKKLALNDLGAVHEETRDLLLALNSPPFLQFLEKLTGIPDLIPDPKFRGGGLHQIERGGKLDVHADFNIHPELKLERRVNVLIYLNSEWSPEYKGDLELWDSGMTRAVSKIAPLFNRLVVLSISDTAFHGHPEPLNCPPEMTRKSLASYYYTVPQKETVAPHSVLFQKRPGDSTTQEDEELRRLRALGLRSQSYTTSKKS